MSVWTAVKAGGFKLSVDGVEKTATGLDFSTATNLNGVASIIGAALAGTTVQWNGSQFVVTSTTSGASSTLGYASAPATGTDVSDMLGLSAAKASRPWPASSPKRPRRRLAVPGSFRQQFLG